MTDMTNSFRNGRVTRPILASVCSLRVARTRVFIVIIADLRFLLDDTTGRIHTLTYTDLLFICKGQGISIIHAGLQDLIEDRLITILDLLFRDIFGFLTLRRCNATLADGYIGVTRSRWKRWRTK